MIVTFLISAYIFTSLLCFRVTYLKHGISYGLAGMFFWPLVILYGVLSGEAWKSFKKGYDEANK